VTANSFVVESRTVRTTMAWGRRLGALLQGGELIGLVGALGAGKTCFVKGLARGLDLPEEQIVSPTFTMIQEHRGRVPLYHIDLYRLERVTIDDLGLRDYLFAEAVSAVEWFERLRDGAEMERISIALSYARGNVRHIEFTAHGERYMPLLDKLNQWLD
jgi:tRNA threonylcarbamoyladenosine biosynthesis protein TsaE